MHCEETGFVKTLDLWRRQWGVGGVAPVPCAAIQPVYTTCVSVLASVHTDVMNPEKHTQPPWFCSSDVDVGGGDLLLGAIG